MESVYTEFEAELRQCAELYRDRPEAEMRQLLLLALEREQIVTTGYREASMAARLSTMDLSEPVRALIRHALFWVWTDEQMHTLYIRGALLKFGGWTLKVRSIAQQLSGAVGGWSSAVRQHVPWRKAPVSRFWATVFTGLGRLAGKVPRAVARELAYHSFRKFARFNIDAERTAALCWQRLAELSRQHPFPHSLTSEFDRMHRDEDRHAQVFEALALALNEADALAPGHSEQTLATAMAGIDGAFLPRALREADDVPLGKGGEVYVAHGVSLEGGPATLKAMLVRLGLRKLLEDRAAATGKPLGELKVAIKTSFMYGATQRDRSTLTDPRLLRALIESLQAAGATAICLIESQNLYDWYFQHRSVADVARYFQIDQLGAPVIDATLDQAPHAYRRGLAQYSVSNAWKSADVRISFGKLKSHSVEQVYLSMANLEGLGPRSDQFIFAERQAERAHATMSLAWDFPPHLALIDGYASAPDGLAGMLGCKKPRAPLRIYGGLDALAVDLVAARHVGTVDLENAPLLRTATLWFGDPRPTTRVVGEDTPVTPWTHPLHNELSATLSLLAYPVFELASGRGALFTAAVDEKAFPPVRAPGVALRAARFAIKKLLSLPT